MRAIKPTKVTSGKKRCFIALLLPRRGLENVDGGKRRVKRPRGRAHASSRSNYDPAIARYGGGSRPYGAADQPGGPARLKGISAVSEEEGPPPTRWRPRRSLIICGSGRGSGRRHLQLAGTPGAS
jgi:hypothetical protein